MFAYFCLLYLTILYSQLKTSNSSLLDFTTVNGKTDTLFKCSQSIRNVLAASIIPKAVTQSEGGGNLLYPSAYYGQGDDGIARQDISPGSPPRHPLEGCTQSKVPRNERWNMTKKQPNLFVFLLSWFFSCLATVSYWAKMKLDKGFLATLCVGKDVGLYLSHQRPTFTICQETIVVSTITVSLVSNCLISGDVSCSF